MGPEATIEKHARQRAQSRGGRLYKLVSPGRKGWPDRGCAHSNCGLFLMEFKARGKKSRQEQVDMANELALLGVRVYLDVDSVQKAFEIIDDEFNCVPSAQRRHHPVSGL